MLTMHARWKNSAQEIKLLEPVETARWEILKRQALRLMKGRMCYDGSLKHLEDTPYELWHATNGFGDKFHVLVYRANTEDYTAMERELDRNQFLHDYAFPDISQAFDEILPKDKPLRFIAMDLDIEDGLQSVPAPKLRITSDTVEAALRDAETLIRTSGAPNALDRVHTAFHAYLKEICEDERIIVAADASITSLFAQMRQRHPKLKIVDPQADKMMLQINRSLAQIIDALNPVRNDKSLAHPNTLLDPAEAMLAINAIRTMLHYLDMRLK